MRAYEFIEEPFQGLDLEMEFDEDEIWVTARDASGRELGHVLFVDTGDELIPQDLEVEERFRGQGIARVMYDWVKSKGYRIRRSNSQTRAGAEFWNKNRPGENVWEQGVGTQGVDLEPLYHASLRAFESEIMSQGLRPGGDTRLFAWSESSYVYLTPDPGVAKSFVDPSVIEPDPKHEETVLRLMEQGGVLFTIDQNQLDPGRLHADPHWYSDPDSGNDSYVYSGTVPPKAIVGRKYFDIS